MNISNNNYHNQIIEMASGFKYRYHRRIIWNNVVTNIFKFMSLIVIFAILQVCFVLMLDYDVSWVVMIAVNECIFIAAIVVTMIFSMLKKITDEEIISVIDRESNLHNVILNSYYLSKSQEKDNYALYAINKGIRCLQGCNDIPVLIEKKKINLPLLLVFNIVLISILSAVSLVDNVILKSNVNNSSVVSLDIDKTPDEIYSISTAIDTKSLENTGIIDSKSLKNSDSAALKVSNISGFKSPYAAPDNSGFIDSKAEIHTNSKIAGTNLASAVNNNTDRYNNQQSIPSDITNQTFGTNSKDGSQDAVDSSLKSKKGNWQVDSPEYFTFNFSSGLKNQSLFQNDKNNRRDVSLPDTNSDISGFNIGNRNENRLTNSTVKYESQIKKSRTISMVLTGITKDIYVTPMVSKGEHIGIVNAVKPASSDEFETPIVGTASENSIENFTYTTDFIKQQKRYFDLVRKSFSTSGNSAAGCN